MSDVVKFAKLYSHLEKIKAFQGFWWRWDWGIIDIWKWFL